MKPRKSAFGALPALVCAAALMPLLACSGADSDTLLVETVRPSESCKFVDKKTGKEIKFDKLVYNGKTFLIALCMEDPFPMEDPAKSKGTVWLVPTPENIKVADGSTTYEDVAIIKAAPERRYALTDGTLTIFPED